MGSNLNYAFIIQGDTILEKTAEGGLDVYDAKMNPVKNYRMPAKQFAMPSSSSTDSLSNNKMPAQVLASYLW